MDRSSAAHVFVEAFEQRVPRSEIARRMDMGTTFEVRCLRDHPRYFMDRTPCGPVEWEVIASDGSSRRFETDPDFDMMSFINRLERIYRPYRPARFQEYHPPAFHPIKESTTMSTTSTESHRRARKLVSKLVGSTLRRSKSIKIAEITRDSTGPLGGTSTKIVAFVKVGKKYVPVAINIYADSNIDAAAKGLIETFFRNEGEQANIRQFIDRT